MPAATTVPAGAAPAAGAAGAAPVEEADAVAAALEDLLAWARRAAPTGGVGLAGASLLVRLARRGPQGVSALAAAEGVSQPAMSQTVARLAREHLVERSSDDGDARRARVALTPAGARAVTERRSARARALARLLADVPPGDAAALRAAAPALARLARAGADAGADPDTDPVQEDAP